MTLYFVTNSERFEDSMILYPRIPKSIDIENNEDYITPRICVSNSVIGCLNSIQNNLGGGCSLNIYKCYVKNKEIYRPTSREVPDVKDTGEVWLLKPTEFYRIMKIKSSNNISEVICNYNNARNK